MDSTSTNYSKSDKSASTALILCIFLGGLGIHRFYVRKIGTGILMLITLGGLGIWTLIDIVNIAYSNFSDGEGRYLEFEKRNDQTSRKVAKILFLILGFFIAFFVFIIFTSMWATSGLTDVARGQLAAIRAHDFNKAYSYTSSEFQKETSASAFEKFLEKYPALLDNKDSTFTNRNIQNNRGIISGFIEGANGESLPIIYYFIYEGGQWKILSIEVNAGQPSENEKTQD